MKYLRKNHKKARIVKIPFKKVRIGQKIEYRFRYSWENSCGKFTENKYTTGIFRKIDNTFIYCDEYETGLSIGENELVQRCK